MTIDAPLAEWKLVFRTLHAHLASNLELMDTEVLSELQSRLQAAARNEGVDVTDHAAWDAWLGHEAPSCGERLEKRRSLN